MSHVFRRRKLLLICLIASMVFSLATVSVPVSSSPGTKVYVEMPIEGYINGTAIGEGNSFTVDVEIENATDMVQWALSVQVDPDVLNVSSATDGAGTVLYDYADDNWMTTVFYVDEYIHAEGKIVNVTHGISQWPDLYPTPGGFDGSGKLCTLEFKVLNETEYSLIHLYDVLLFDGQNYTTGTPHYFPPDIVEDGHYNEPPVGVCGVDITDVEFLKGTTPVTDGYPTWTINVNVTVHNNGTLRTNCTVNAYYQDGTWILIGTQSITDLDPCNTTTRTFSWNLAGLTPCTNYTVKANATCTCTASDEFTTAIYIRLTGDTNNNGFVGSDDIILVQKPENYQQNTPANTYTDVNNNGFVGSDDIILIQKPENYQQGCP